MDAIKSVDSLKMVLCALLLAGCSSGDGDGVFSGGVVGEVPKNARETGGTFNNESLLEGQSIRETLLGQGVDENRLPVNKYLWRASLDILDSVLPLATVDTFSGVIATDWGSTTGTTNERVRATVLVKDTELTASALSVSVFRETLSPGGVWQSAVVSPQTAGQLEDAILTKARQLRIADIES